MRLIALCAAALTGLAVGDVSRLEPPRLVLGGLLAVVASGLAWRRPAWRLLALVVFAAALGGLRAALVTAADAAALDPYLGLLVRVRGRVDQPPTLGPASAQVVLDTPAVGPAGREPPALADQSAPGARVRVVGDRASMEGVTAGEVLVLEGRLLASDGRAPPTLLFPRLLGRGTPAGFEVPALVGGARAATLAGIYNHLPEPQASLSAGVLLGGPGHLDAAFRMQLQRSGLAHIVAIDGFKQVIVAGVLAAEVARPLLGPKAAAVVVLLGIASYTLLTGAHPSAVRAGLMVGLATLASLTGRVADPLTSVMLAVTVMAAMEPRILLDVGLQLSLSAILGIVLLWPGLRRRLRGVPRLVAEPVGLTVAVTVATLPVALSVFQLVSLVSPVAHIVAMPLLPPVLVSTVGLALAAPVPSLATAVGWLAWLPSTLLVMIVQVTGSLPGAALATGRLPPVAAAGLAGALLAWGLAGLPEAAGLRQRWAAARSSRGRRVRTPGLCAVASLAVALALHMVRPDGRLHVHRLAVGRGDAVFIRGPTGRTALVVGGRVDAVQLVNQVADHLAVWEHHLDRVLQLDSAAQPGLGLTLARYAAEQHPGTTGDARIDLGNGAALDVYAPEALPDPAVSISFGQVWLPLVGRPPPPASYLADARVQNVQPAAELISDGIDVWAAGEAAVAAAQQPLAADVRSGLTTSAARPG